MSALTTIAVKITRMHLRGVQLRVEILHLLLDDVHQGVDLRHGVVEEPALLYDCRGRADGKATKKRSKNKKEGAAGETHTNAKIEYTDKGRTETETLMNSVRLRGYCKPSTADA